MKEDYELLGIPETITNEELEKAYKDIKRKYHPDNNLENNEEATKKFQEAQQAYNRIKEKREKEKIPVILNSDDFYIQKEKLRNTKKALEQKLNSYIRELGDINKNISCLKRKQENNRFTIMLNLNDLIQEVINYFSRKLEHKTTLQILSHTFKQKEKLTMQKEFILPLLKELQNKLKVCIETKDDSLILTLEIGEKEITILNKIAFSEFQKFQHSLNKYQNIYESLSSSLNLYLEEQKQKEQNKAETEKLLTNVNEKLEKVKQEYYKVYPENKDRDTFDDNFEDLQGTIFR